ncbi:MAG: prepilin peptidase [Candidatus Woesearchaeota archaeon]|nr:MAG: prepilin peptidase [Candidatus Woesearchaeota archaeon]
MFADIFFVSILILGSITAVYTDFKRREVPDWINYFLIITGLLGHAIISLIQNSPKPLLCSATVAFIFFIVANVMYYTGSWGGGDAKFLVGLGALMPIYPQTFLKLLNPTIAEWPFVITLFFNTLLFGAILGILYTGYKAVKNWEKVRKEIVLILKRKSIIITRAVLLSSAILIFLALLFFREFSGIIVFLWTMVILLFYSLILSMAVEKISMFKKIKPSQLTEGDWIAKDVKVDKEIIYKQKRTGIEIKDIKRLVELEKKGKLKEVIIKEGLPFLPAFLAGILFSLIFGDILFKLFTTVLY